MKEKLMREAHMDWARSIARTLNKDLSDNELRSLGRVPFEHAYDAGFSKALELAAKVCDQGDGRMSSMHEHILGNMWRDQILQIGEQEESTKVK